MTSHTLRVLRLLAAMAGGWVCGFLAAPAAAGEEVEFFDDKDLSFEQPPSPPESSARSPTPTPLPVVRSDAPRPHHTPPALARPKVFPTPPPPPRPSPKGLPSPEQAKHAYERALTDAMRIQPTRSGREPSDVPENRVKVLRVRALTQDERQAMGSSLRCSDPIAGEIVPGASLRLVIAQSLSMTTEQLPMSFAWIVGRNESCFDRRTSPSKELLERVDDAVRQAARALEF